jgi:hypothetical protein
MEYLDLPKVSLAGLGIVISCSFIITTSKKTPFAPKSTTLLFKPVKSRPNISVKKVIAEAFIEL